MRCGKKPDCRSLPSSPTPVTTVSSARQSLFESCYGILGSRELGQGNIRTQCPCSSVWSACTAYVHTVIGENSRVADAEIHGGETALTAAGLLKRSVSWFTACGVTVERVLSESHRARRGARTCLHLRAGGPLAVSASAPPSKKWTPK